MKKNMKWIAAVLGLAVFAAMTLGCGQSGSSGTKQVVSDKEPETEASEGSAAEEGAEDSEDLSDVTVTIDEQVLVEQDGIVVTAMEDDMSINGFMTNPLFSTTVYDGKKSLDDITVFSSDLEENGIEVIEKVELKFHIYDADSYSTIADSEPITFSAQ